MRLGYRCFGQSLRVGRRQLLLALGMLALPISICTDSFADGLSPVLKAPALPLTLLPLETAVRPKAVDPRAVRLRAFLAKLNCPVKDLADDFIVAADQNHLDWRLLPSISVIESGGGKNYRNNNIFGWNQGLQVFASIRSGIQEVASRLAHSPIYRSHPDVVSKLHLYNPDQGYAANVVAVMKRISPAPATL